MLVQIAAIARGEDLRGDDDAYYPADKVQTVGKIYGQYVPLGSQICSVVANMFSCGHCMRALEFRFGVCLFGRRDWTRPDVPADYPEGLLKGKQDRKARAFGRDEGKKSFDLPRQCCGDITDPEICKAGNEWRTAQDLRRVR